MKHFLFLTMVLVGVSACAPTGDLVRDNNWTQSQAYESYDTAGQKLWFIQCNGSLNTMGSCMQRANVLCPNGYTLIDQSEATAGSFGTATVNPAGGTAIGGHGVSRYMRIRCK